jgi:hypothetical protein
MVLGKTIAEIIFENKTDLNWKLCQKSKPVDAL